MTIVEVKNIMNIYELCQEDQLYYWFCALLYVSYGENPSDEQWAKLDELLLHNYYQWFLESIERMDDSPDFLVLTILKLLNLNVTELISRDFEPYFKQFIFVINEYKTHFSSKYGFIQPPRIQGLLENSHIFAVDSTNRVNFHFLEFLFGKQFFNTLTNEEGNFLFKTQDLFELNSWIVKLDTNIINHSVYHNHSNPQLTWKDKKYLLEYILNSVTEVDNVCFFGDKHRNDVFYTVTENFANNDKFMVRMTTADPLTPSELEDFKFYKTFCPIKEAHFIYKRMGTNRHKAGVKTMLIQESERQIEFFANINSVFAERNVFEYKLHCDHSPFNDQIDSKWYNCEYIKEIVGKYMIDYTKKIIEEKGHKVDKIHIISFTNDIMKVYVESDMSIHDITNELSIVYFTEEILKEIIIPLYNIQRKYENPIVEVEDEN